MVHPRSNRSIKGGSKPIDGEMSFLANTRAVVHHFNHSFSFPSPSRHHSLHCLWSRGEWSCPRLPDYTKCTWRSCDSHVTQTRGSHESHVTCSGRELCRSGRGRGRDLLSSSSPPHSLSQGAAYPVERAGTQHHNTQHREKGDEHNIHHNT